MNNVVRNVLIENFLDGMKKINLNHIHFTFSTSTYLNILNHLNMWSRKFLSIYSDEKFYQGFFR